MFDVLTIAAVADELGETLLDGRVQKVGLVDRLTLAAEVYAGGRRRWLVASADASRARLHLTDVPPSLDPACVTPFGLLLRKYVRGGVVVGVEQPPLERLVRLSIAKRLGPHNDGAAGGRRPRHSDETSTVSPGGLVADPAELPRPWDPTMGDDAADDGAVDLDPDEDGVGDATYVHLVVELMGRHSNLLLVDDAGVVMGAAKHVTPAMSRVRPVRPRLPYVPPPPIDKPDPRRLTSDAASRLLAAEAGGAGLAKTLVNRLRAVSPQMAREIAFRVAGDAAITVGALEPDAPALVARETRALLEPLLTSAWAPAVYRRDGDVVAFAAVALAHRRAEAGTEEERVASISVAADAAETAAGPGTSVDHAQRRGRLIRSIRDARDKVDARLAALEVEEAKADEAERLREWGELIYAYLWQIRPGDAALDVDGTTVPLDPALSAKENAQAYFERYRKAQGAGSRLPELEAKAARELEYLDQLLTMAEQASGFAELEALTAEWEAQRGGAPVEGRRAAPKRALQAKRPKPLLDDDGNAVYVGHSGRQNDAITFDLAGPDDTWLHARGVPGSHVVVRWRQPSPDEDPETIEAAAALAAYYSAARGSASVEVDVTRRRHVRKIKGAGPGMVTYRNERTISIQPADEEKLDKALTRSNGP